MAGDKLRLFTAVTIPRPRLEWLRAVTGDLRDVPGARWIEPENQHVTLNFLGWVDAALLDTVTGAVDAVAARHAPGALALSGLGAFPSARRARVLWCGLDDPARLLPALAGDLGAELRLVGYEPEQRAYTAHLTLARLQRPRAVDLPEIPSSEPFEADRVTLFRSRLGPSGARYEVVHQSYLASAGGSD